MRHRYWLIWLFSISVLTTCGCTKSCESCASGSAAGFGKKVSEDSSWIVVVDRRGILEPAVILAVQFPKGWPFGGEAIDGSSNPPARLSPPRMVKFARWYAASKNLLYIVTTPDETLRIEQRMAIPWKLTRVDLANGVSTDYSLGRIQPSAVKAIGNYVLLGSDAEVWRIDTSSSKPQPELLHHRDEIEKPYHLFAIDKSTIVAIDDEVTPYYADTFSMDEKGKIEHISAWSMPELVNGHYRDAQLHMTDSVSGTLYALDRFGVIDGSGQNIFALKIEGGSFSESSWHRTLEESKKVHKLSIEEFSPSDGIGEPKLIAGDRYTSWSALELLPLSGDSPGRVVAAAAERGVLVLPLDLSSDSSGLVDVGGSCLDLAVRKGVLFALVSVNGDSQTTGVRSNLVALKWSLNRLSVVGTVELDREYDMFAD